MHALPWMATTVLSPPLPSFVHDRSTLPRRRIRCSHPLSFGFVDVLFVSWLDRMGGEERVRSWDTGLGPRGWQSSTHTHTHTDTYVVESHLWTTKRVSSRRRAWELEARGGEVHGRCTKHPRGRGGWRVERTRPNPSGKVSWSQPKRR